MMPYFLQALVYSVRHWYDDTSEDFRWGVAIFFGIALIVLAFCSVATVVHEDKNGKVMYCTTLLGERTDCND